MKREEMELTRLGWTCAVASLADYVAGCQCADCSLVVRLSSSNHTPHHNYSLNQWRIQDFSEGDAAGVWPPIFFGRDDPHFLWQIVSAHRRSQDFQRVGAPKGGSRISGWGTMEGRKAPNEAR